MQRRSIWCLLGLLVVNGSSLLYAERYPTWGDQVSLTGDLVYMRRQKLHHHTLVSNTEKPQCPTGCPNFSVLRNKHLANELGFEPGYRLGATFSVNPKNSLEANAIFVEEWTAQKEKEGNQSLYFFANADFSHDFTNASHAKARYETTFWDAELNYWYNFAPRNFDYFGLSGIVGLRYFQIYDHFILSMTNTPNTSDYDIQTHNNLYGIQVGFDFQVNPMRYMSWDFFAKFGTMATQMYENTFLGDYDNSVTLRDFQDRKWTGGLFTDVAAQLEFHFLRHFHYHLGYQFIFISGLALAPNQIDKTTSTRHYLNSTGSVYLQAFFTGLRVTF